MASAIAGVGLWEWCADGDDLRWDANTQAIFGLPPDDRRAGRERLLGCVEQEDRGTVESLLRTSVEQGAPFSARFRIRRCDGKTAYVIARGAVLRDDAQRIVGMAGAFLDVTKEELSRELLRIAVEASPSALMIVRRSGEIVLVNTMAEAVFGYERAELIGNIIDRLVPHEVKPMHAELRESYFAAPSPRRLGAGRDLAGIRKDGRAVPLEITLAPVQLDDGPGVLASIVDISERRELLAQLAQAERLAAVGELAAGIAHEINNPVNTMINCAQLVLDGDDSAENCKIVVEEGERIAAIVKDLLQFAGDDGKSHRNTALVEVVETCLRLIGESTKRHGISMLVDVPGELPLVQADPKQLQQVVLNLLLNAKDALLEKASHGARRIDIVARPRGAETIRCSVRDNGPGVPAELRARIFMPFVTTKRARGGTGLGLSVSRTIISNFGGTIELESVPGEFAEFSIVLPIARNSDEPPADAHP